MQIAITTLVAVVSGVAIGVLASGWLTSEARIARNQVLHYATIAQSNFANLHGRLLALEQEAVKKLEAIKEDVIN